MTCITKSRFVLPKSGHSKDDFRENCAKIGIDALAKHSWAGMSQENNGV
jgi:hypothetical protein